MLVLAYAWHPVALRWLRRRVGLGATQVSDETLFVSSVRWKDRDPWAQVIGMTEEALDDAVDALIKVAAEKDYTQVLLRTDARPTRLSELVLTIEQYDALKAAGSLCRWWRMKQH